MIDVIGVTERGDDAPNTQWVPWVSDGKPAILISKAPSGVYTHLKNYQLMEANIILHCNITGMGATLYEPNVLPWPQEIEFYNKLVDAFGPERIVLRIDPIFPQKGLLIEAINVARHVKGRLRISIYDNYPHVQRRLSDAGLPVPDYQFHAPLPLRRALVSKFDKLLKDKTSGKYTVEVCGEPSIPSLGCVSAVDASILGVDPVEQTGRGQRTHCHCLANKHDLLNDRSPCAHNCIYCYWKRK